MYGLPCPGLDRPHVDGVEALVRAQLGAGLAQRPGDALAPSARVRAHVLGHVDRARADLPGERRQLALGPAAADHEARPALAELAVEVGEALEQELGPRPGRVAPVQEAVVEAERPGRRGRPRRARRAAPGGRGRGGRAAATRSPFRSVEPRDQDDLVGRRVDHVLGEVLDRARRRGRRTGTRTRRRGRELGRRRDRQPHSGQAKAPRARTWRPSVTRRGSSPTAEPPVRPSLTSGSPRSPGSGAIESHSGESLCDESSRSI